MAIDLIESVRARLTAYIAPNKPNTEVQKQAFEIAVSAQVEYEQTAGSASTMIRGADSYSVSNDGVTISVTGAGSAGAAYTEATLSPYVWALLKNVGLLRAGAIPAARRI